MTSKTTSTELPPGLSPRYSVQVSPRNPITGFCWSPDGNQFAIAQGNKLELRDTENGFLKAQFINSIGSITGLAWSPDGACIAVATETSVLNWDLEGAKLLWTHKTSAPASMLAWSPDGRYLAFCKRYSPVTVLDRRHQGSFVGAYGVSPHAIAWFPGNVLSVLEPNGGVWYFEPPKDLLQDRFLAAPDAMDLVVAPSSHLFIMPTERGPMEVRDSKAQRLRFVLEGHSSPVYAVSFSSGEQLVASCSSDNVLKFWDCHSWRMVATLHFEGSPGDFICLDFHPRKPLLAKHGRTPDIVYIWDVDVEELLKPRPTIRRKAGEEEKAAANRPIQFVKSKAVFLKDVGVDKAGLVPGMEAAAQPTQYVNAKVVLVGDSGVGKSGLALVLTKQPFTPTLSSHGRHVWMFESKKVRLDEKLSETRETLLWDLAGQPSYRLVHQLHLNEIAVALVVFDAQSDTDPLAGVRHWDRALRQAQRIQGTSALPLKKFLVAGRVDRGHVSLSQARIDALVRSLGFDGYFKTSAKEGLKIPELIQAIRKAINWDVLTRVSSSELLEKLKSFLILEKKAGRLLSTADDLYRAFLRSPGAPPEDAELQKEFENCIVSVASRGLIRRLSFGGLVLLQPEMLDAYASALVDAAKDEPDGLGSIAEEVARAGTFAVPQDERVKSPAQERLLLIAMVEDLLYHEIALREHADGGAYLTFPSQLTRELQDLQELKGKAVVFSFEGPVLNIYATLVVRLSHSNWFQKKELWKNAAIFTTKTGGEYGVALREPEEGKGELTIFYDEAATPESRRQFEEYIFTHLHRRSLQEAIFRRRIITCPDCGIRISDEQATGRLKLGEDSINCPVCGRTISLRSLNEQMSPSVAPSIRQMEQGADARRDVEKAVTIIEGKRATGDYDIFFSYNTADREAVLRIAGRLAEHGFLAWVDIEGIRPGKSVQKVLEKQLKRCKAAAIFVGKRGVGPWQRQEAEARLQSFVNRGSTIIPVLLEDAPKQPKLPVFLGNLRWVDFRQKEPDPLKELLWGITGKRT